MKRERRSYEGLTGSSRTGARRTLPALCIALALAGCAQQTLPPPGAAPPAALLPPPAPKPGPAYRIQVGDELHVRFIHQPDLDEKVPVRPDGRITLATTGEIAALGLRPTELEQVIIERSSSDLREPEVVVIVTKIGGQRVYVGGEVVRPGWVDLRPGMTPLQAVMDAGGFRHSGNLESVILITPDSEGQFAASRIDMKDVVEHGVPERVRLHADSVVYVPTTWIADANIVVDQWVRGLIPVLPRVGVGYSLNPSSGGGN
jgi:polysaccharide export outer membrane protein